jgi:hypothetical protein
VGRSSENSSATNQFSVVQLKFTLDKLSVKSSLKYEKTKV